MIVLNRRMRNPFRRALVWLAAAAIGAAACGPAETNAQTGGSAPPSGSRSANPQSAVTPAPPPLVLEFDLPAEFRNGGEVTGFRVGFFRANNLTAIRTIDIAGDALTVRDRTGRVTLSRESVPPCSGDCVVRVQTLSRADASAWSAPVPLSGPAIRQSRITPQQPRSQQPRVTRPQQPRNRLPRRQTVLTLSGLENYDSLVESLRKLLPPDANVEDELRRFRRVPDLALVVVLSRDYDIPFTTLSKALEGRPPVGIRDELTKLRPQLNVAEAIRKSRAESLRLLEMQETKVNTP